MLIYERQNSNIVNNDQTALILSEMSILASTLKNIMKPVSNGPCIIEFIAAIVSVYQYFSGKRFFGKKIIA